MANQKIKKLGSNPLDWIGQSNQEQKKIPKESDKISNIIEEKRETFIVRTELSDKIKDYAYWERIKQKDAINLMLEYFFKNHPTKKRPEENK